MNHAFCDPIPPVQETVQHKTDVLDWEAIASYESDLEFRLETPFAPDEQWGGLWRLSVTSLAAGPVAWAIGTWVARYLFTDRCLMAALLLGFILTGLSELRRLRRPLAATDPILGRWTLRILVGPSYLWLVVALSARSMRPTGAFLYLLAVSLPVAIYVADAMATHCVYWMTASWSLDHASMCRTRDAWRSRFDPASPYSLTTRESGASRLAHLGAAAIRQHTAYRLGPVWLLAAIVWPTCLILATSPRGADAIVPLRVVVGVVLGLLVAGLVRSQLRFEAAVHFWRALVHWLHYDDGPMPPWVFHSPCGPPQRRRLMTSVAVCLFSVPIFGMSATGLWGCVMESNMFPALIPPPTDLDSAFAQIHAAVSHASKLASLRGLLFLALAMVSLLVIPPAVLLLAMFLLIGPLVLTYYEVYEKQERL